MKVVEAFKDPSNLSISSTNPGDVFIMYSERYGCKRYFMLVRETNFIHCHSGYTIVDIQDGRCFGISDRPIDCIVDQVHLIKE